MRKLIKETIYLFLSGTLFILFSLILASGCVWILVYLHVIDAPDSQPLDASVTEAAADPADYSVDVIPDSDTALQILEKAEESGETEKAEKTEEPDDISYESFNTGPSDMDVDEYFRQNSKVFGKINAKSSDDVFTEKDVSKLLAERGFWDIKITTEYDMDGGYHDAYEISDNSSNKHPMYEAYYVTSKDEIWTIIVINGDIMAIPVSYGIQYAPDVETVISEYESVTSYDSSENVFYENVPYESMMDVKVVERIDAKTLENLTADVINTL